MSKSLSSAVAIALLITAMVTAFGGAASANPLTSPAGSTYTGSLKGEAEGKISIHNSSLGVTVTCEESILEGNVESHNSLTAGGSLTKFTLAKCGADTVTILKSGALEIHGTTGSDGTVTWTGAEITVKNGSTGVSCIYKTTATDIGTLTGGTPATLDLGSTTLPREGDNIFCGTKGTLTGSYKFTTPSTLLVDS